jgi:hypothetical protein
MGWRGRRRHRRELRGHRHLRRRHAQHRWRLRQRPDVRPLVGVDRRVRLRAGRVAEPRADRVSQLERGREPLGRILREAAHHERIDLGRDPRHARRRRQRHLGQMHHDDLADALRVERRLAGEQHVHHAAHRVDIRAQVDLAGTTALLGRHERRRAHDGRGQRLLRRVAAVELRDTEIEELGPLAAHHLGIADEEDVLGLEIAVDDAAHVRRVQRARDRPHDAQRVADLEYSEARQPPIERLTLEELHHDVRALVDVIAEVEDLDDARIGDRRRGAGLVEEPGYDLGLAREALVEHLDRRTPPQHRVFREPHRPHPAFTDLLDDSVCPNLHTFEHVACCRLQPGGSQPLVDHSLLVKKGNFSGMIEVWWPSQMGATNRLHL